MPTEEEIEELVKKGEQFLTPHDIAFMLNLERDTIRRKMQKGPEGEFKDAFKLNGQWYMTRKDFTKYLNEYLTKGGKK